MRSATLRQCPTQNVRCHASASSKLRTCPGEEQTSLLSAVFHRWRIAKSAAQGFQDVFRPIQQGLDHLTRLVIVTSFAICSILSLQSHIDRHRVSFTACIKSSFALSPVAGIVTQSPLALKYTSFTHHTDRP
ncbi:hypothetical protein P171DRAFT_115912 [Karstenula rhodostoma CBS 690.94]|uniref:Uncharacterized protein n=1 Tax=Karstenula rhodostoma CBS 690.94 TaxID=1392251 RepID=A0A9P4U7L8_9PLEO|nr:hypothetical protein P171DRAFT_115912 [Karstenula rhodostoma CBS 690.94]